MDKKTRFYVAARWKNPMRSMTVAPRSGHGPCFFKTRCPMTSAALHSSMQAPGTRGTVSLKGGWKFFHWKKCVLLLKKTPRKQGCMKISMSREVFFLLEIFFLLAGNKCCSFGCFLKWWYPPNTPKLSFLWENPWLLGTTILGNPHLGL